MGTLASTWAGGSGGDAGGGTGETDLDLDPFDPNVASSPLIHTRPLPFTTLPFFASEIAPSSSSGDTGERARGCTAGAGAKAGAGFHWTICEGAETDTGAGTVAPGITPELEPAWILFATPEEEGGKMSLGRLWVRLTLCAAWAELE